ELGAAHFLRGSWAFLWPNRLVVYRGAGLAAVMSHSLIVLSAPPDARTLPSGVNTTALTKWLWPFSSAQLVFVATSHSRTDLRSQAEASVRPSGANPRPWTTRVAPWREAFSFPAATSHSLIVPSRLPEANVAPSGENATALIQRWCPLRV